MTVAFVDRAKVKRQHKWYYWTGNISSLNNWTQSSMMLTHHWLSHTIIWFPDLRVCLFSTGSGEKAETRGEAEEAGSYRRPAERKECRRVGVWFSTSTFLSLIPLFLTSTSLRSGSAFLKITPYSTRSFKKKQKKKAITVDHRDEKFMNDYSVINYLHKSH